MVKRTASEPAALTQRQVEDLAAGRSADIATLLHVARSTPPAARRAPAGSQPVAVSAREAAALARQGKAPAALARRIAAAQPAAAPAARRGPADAGSQPGLEPPGSG